jgi:hypothetical protein
MIRNSGGYMKKFKIQSKVYVSMNVPISNSRTLSIPKKGSVTVLECQEFPEILKTYVDNHLIQVEEIKD